MAGFLRRRGIGLDNCIIYPRIILPYGGTPWTTMVTIVAPNVLYVGTQNWNAAYYNLRARTRTDPAKKYTTEWFSIPANAECKLVLRNVQRKSGGTDALSIGLYLIDTSNVTVASITTGSIAKNAAPVTVSTSFTTTDAVSVSNMYVRGWSTSRNFMAECELWVNGKKWL